MAKTIILPKLGLTMKKGKIGKWHKMEGEQVIKDEPLLEVITEKANVAVDAQDSGILYKILVGEGIRLPVNTPIAILAEEGDEEEQLQQILAEAQKKLDEGLNSLPGKPQEEKVVIKTPPAVVSGKKSISPRAKKLAQQHGLDIEMLQSAGSDNRITEKDVVTYLEDLAKDDEIDSIPFEGMRQIIAERMAESCRNAARVTIMEEVDVTVLRYLRSKINQAYGQEGLKVSFTDLIIKIAAQALREHKNMNSRVYADKIQVANGVNMGIAVDIEGGLVVPVIHKVHRMNIQQISAKVNDLAQRARSGDLEGEELQGGTFTISNIGMEGVAGFTPIMNPPETAILGIGAIIEKPTVQDDNKIVKKSLMTLSLSFDHRAVDGAPAARFLKRIKALIEDPFAVFGMEIDAAAVKPIVIGGFRNPQHVYDKFKNGMDGLAFSNPDLITGFGALTESVFYDGELTEMHKELIAVAISVYLKCEYCIAAHVYKALRQGATSEQIMEACNVAVFFGGGAALAYFATFIEDCIDAFAAQ